MTEVLTGVEDLRFRVEHGIPLYYQGHSVTLDEAKRILRNMPTRREERIVHPEERTLTLVPDEVIAERTLVCSRCDLLRPTTDRCGAIGCGCSISHRRKYTWGTCPMSKWPLLLPVETPGI